MLESREGRKGAKGGREGAAAGRGGGWRERLARREGGEGRVKKLL